MSKRFWYSAKGYCTKLKLDKNLEPSKVFFFMWKILFKALTKFGLNFGHFERMIVNKMLGLILPTTHFE